jgi:hypothetical protein
MFSPAHARAHAKPATNHQPIDAGAGISAAGIHTAGFYRAGRACHAGGSRAASLNDGVSTKVAEAPSV